MATYIKTTPVEAVQFTVTKEQKSDISSRKRVGLMDSGDVRREGEEYFGTLAVKGTNTIIREGDYMILENGIPVEIVSESDFKANYAPKSSLEAAKKEADKK